MVKRILLVLLIASGCSKNQQQKEILFSLREISELATVEYTVTKIIKANDNKTWFKIGERKILMSCEAHIKAGVDMSSITKKDFIINDKDITLQLPPPKVISLSIPAETIKVEFQDMTILPGESAAAGYIISLINCPLIVCFLFYPPIIVEG